MVTGSRIERKKYNRQKNNKKPKSPYPYRGISYWLKRLVILGVFLAFILILAGAGLFGYYAMSAPNLSQSDLEGQVSSKIYDRTGVLVKELGGQNRDLLTEEELPDNLVQAVLAIEDARFYDHRGVDPIRIVGAALANLRSGEIVQGGSTITQQLVKLSVFSTDFQDQTLERKTQEAWLALQLEQKLTKQEILTLYLNKLFYSNNTYGAKTAARHFFNKDIQDLSLAEAALLAGIPQAPTEYDPYQHPQQAQERRDLVLDVMYERDLISSAQLQEAKQIPIEDMLVPLNDSQATYNFAVDAFIDVVAQEVQDKLNLNIYTDGVEVYTTMDYRAQQHLYETVNTEQIVPFGNDQLQTAVSIIDVQTGQLQAIIGGRRQEVSLGLNRANTLKRSIGSTMKPLSAYGPALEYLNYSTGTLVEDEPYTYSTGDKLFNYDFDYKGHQTLREALAGSRNIPALKMLQAAGLDNAYAFLQKLDINILNNNRRELVEANAIGGEVNPIQLSAAYAAISNYGQFHDPYTVQRVITRAGSEEVFESTAREAMKDSTAYMLTDILKGVPGNFASQSQIEGIYQAGKTGTTNYTSDQLTQLGIDESVYAAPDSWYVGFTPQYAIATWVGYDNPYKPGNYLTFEDTILPQLIYKEMMTFMMRDTPAIDWQQPTSVSRVEIEKYTEPIKLPGPYTPAAMRSEELFVKGTEPKDISMAFGRQLNLPTDFDANYQETERKIVAKWGPLTDQGQFELTVNGQIVYTGTAQSFEIPIEDDGEYVLKLRIVDGNSSSDALVLTLKIDHASQGNQNDHFAPPMDTLDPWVTNESQEVNEYHAPLEAPYQPPVESQTIIE